MFYVVPSVLLHCTVYYCTVLYITALYCILLYCTVYYCSTFENTISQYFSYIQSTKQSSEKDMFSSYIILHRFFRKSIRSSQVTGLRSESSPKSLTFKSKSSPKS
ncbi:hypothetical protein NL108_008741 [Boleophthalmus pectinirostris]|nr:hypothetical protein NL108_008741 [Boleophthalmus pectinirostris]